MKSYVWTIDMAVASHLRGNGGVSPSYVMPGAIVPKSPRNLAGARLWVVLRSIRESTLFGKLHVDMVELFEDGLNAGDFCLTVDMSKSFVCSRENATLSHHFNITLKSRNKAGLIEADEEMDARMIEVMERNVLVKLQDFPKALFKKIGAIPLKGDAFSKARELIVATTTTFCLDELWGSGSDPRMPPFSNFAYRWLKKYHADEATQEMRKFLDNLDPVTITRLKLETSTGKKLREKKSVPVIDIQLVTIDPEKIFARRFVAKDPTVIDYMKTIEKTEHAEKRHQDMLRDIASKLLSIGLNPMQSSSIDLFLQVQKKNMIFELKTATSDNLISQCAKGLFQLGCYGNALDGKGYKNVHLVLIVETTGQTELDNYAAKIIESFDVTAFFYYPERSWPQKVSRKKGNYR